MIVETWKIKNKWSDDPKIIYFEDIPLFLFYFKVCQSFHLQETFKVKSIQAFITGRRQIDKYDEKYHQIWYKLYLYVITHVLTCILLSSNALHHTDMCRLCHAVSYPHNL